MSLLIDNTKGHDTNDQTRSRQNDQGDRRAKTVRPRVRVISADDRTYAVTGSKGDNYTVKFAVANGHKLAECDCPARGLCYHIAAAASVNIGVQSMRQQAAKPEVLATKGATSRAELEAAIVKTWSAKFPHDHLADALMYRFKVNSLSFLADGWLQDILAAIA